MEMRACLPRPGDRPVVLAQGLVQLHATPLPLGKVGLPDVPYDSHLGAADLNTETLVTLLLLNISLDLKNSDYKWDQKSARSSGSLMCRENLISFDPWMFRRRPTKDGSRIPSCWMTPVQTEIMDCLQLTSGTRGKI